MADNPKLTLERIAELRIRGSRKQHERQRSIAAIDLVALCDLAEAALKDQERRRINREGNPVDERTGSND